MATAENPEYLAIQEHFTKLQDVITRGEVLPSLFQNRLISRDAFEKANNEALPRSKRATDTILDILDNVKLNPTLFDKFCDALKEDEFTGDIISKLKGYFQCFIILSRSVIIR